MLHLGLPVKELAIYSPSNVAVNYQLAPLPERSLAFLVDLVVTLALGQLFIQTIGKLLIALIGADHFLYLFIYVFSQLGIFLLYFALTEYYYDGRTLGKHMLGLRTIRVDGAIPTFETYAIRASMLFLDFLLGLGSIGYLAAGSSPLRQRIGDRIAQTVVIRRSPRSLYQLHDILGIKTVEDHEVLYPMAAELEVEQALLLKELIVNWEERPGEQLRKIISDASDRLAVRLGLDYQPRHKLEFMRQVLHDYIVLTR